MLNINRNSILRSCVLLAIAAAAPFLAHYGRTTAYVGKVMAQSKPFSGAVIEQAQYNDCNPESGKICAPVQTVQTAVNTNFEYAVTNRENTPEGPREERVIAFDGYRTSIFPETRQFYRFKTLGASRDVLRQTALDGARNCEVSFFGDKKLGTVLGTELILGYRTIKISSSNGGANATDWYAPDLGCFKLKSIREWKRSDGVKTTASYMLPVSVVPGTPKDDLFQAPADFADETPLKVMHDVRVGRLKSRGVSDADAEAEFAAMQAKDTSGALKRLEKTWRIQRGLPIE